MNSAFVQALECLTEAFQMQGAALTHTVYPLMLALFLQACFLSLAFLSQAFQAALLNEQVAFSVG
jgi:hypothetical protein